VLVRDAESIASLLSAIEVREMLDSWHQPTRGGGAPVKAFGNANLLRAQAAAEQACTEVEDALRILGEEVPAHLAEAGVLRLAHREATLEELGQRYADPPLSKDAMAGRIRRLLQLAERTTKHSPADAAATFRRGA
jgi:DNA-binding protein WhiA